MTAERKLERLRGRVTHTAVRKGTGSEHEGVVLETAGGERLILVRIGGNPFDDPDTRALAGRTVEVEGYRVGNELRFVSTRDTD